MANAEDAFTLLAEAFGVKLSPARIAAWRDACRDLHPDDIGVAVRELIQTAERMPTVAQVRRSVLDLPQRHHVEDNRPKRRFQVVCCSCAERYETSSDGSSFHTCDPDWLAYFQRRPEERQSRGLASISGRSWQPAPEPKKKPS